MTKTADPNIEFLLQEFSARLTELVERRTIERLQVAAAALIGSSPERAARAPRAPYVEAHAVRAPVPGCKNPPAPAFGMVCSSAQGPPEGGDQEIPGGASAREEGESDSAAAIPSNGRANGKPRKRPAIPA
jgi:hypothetical protein